MRSPEEQERDMPKPLERVRSGRLALAAMGMLAAPYVGERPEVLTAPAASRQTPASAAAALEAAEQKRLRKQQRRACEREQQERRALQVQDQLRWNRGRTR